MNALDVSRWLWNFYLAATVLLAVVLLAGMVIAQPARRMALAWATVGGLVALMLLTMIPNWSRIALLPPAPREPAWTAELEPVLGPAIQQTPLSVATASPPQLSPNGEPVAVATRIVVVDWGILASAVVLIGSGIVVVWLLLGAWQIRRLRARAEAVPAEVANLFDGLAPNSSIQLAVSKELPVAVAVGLQRPGILLPQTMVWQASREQLRSVLAHELAHVEHHDLWLLALLRLLTVVFWPHPLFWHLRRQVRRDQEVLADTAAAEITSRTDYAEQLVALARSAVEMRVPRLASSVGLWENRTQLTERIKLLLDEKLTILRSCPRRWRLGSLLVLGGLAIALSLVTLSPAGQSEAAAKKTTVISEGSAPEKFGGVETEPSHTVRDIDIEDPENLDLQKSFDSSATDLEPNTVTGICFDENNQPLAGVAVNVFEAKEGAPHKPTTIASMTSGVDGRFRFENVVNVKSEFPEGLPDENFIPPGSPVYNVVARMPGRVSGIGNELAFQIARRGMMKPFSMPPAQSLTGRIVDQDNRPVAGALVSTGMWGEVVGIPEGVNSALADADGRFEIVDLEAYDAEQARKEFEARQQDYLSVATFAGSGQPWERFITVEHPDFARKRAKITSIPGSEDVTLSPGAVLTGQVVTQEAGAEPKPAADAEVTAMLLPAGDSPSPLSYQVLTEMTDEAGNYRFGSLRQGNYVVHAYKPDWVTNGLGDIKVPQGETVAAPQLIMMRGAQVRIQLVDDATDKPLEFAEPTKAYVSPLHRPLPKNVFGTRPNIVEFTHNGEGEIQVSAGNYLFNVVIPTREGAPGWMRADFNANLSTEQIESVPGQKVGEGEVVDIEVRMMREEQSVNDQPEATITPAATPPAEYGSAIREQAAEEPAVAQPAPSHKENYQEKYLELRKLAKPNAILGFCVSESNKPLEGVQVELYEQRLRRGEPQKLRSTTSDAEGKFTFENVVDIAKEFPDGFNKQDEVFAPENTRILAVVARHEGRVTRLNNDTASRVAQFGQAIILPMPPSQTLHGVITDINSNPVADAEVSFGPSAAGFPSALTTVKTDSKGNFILHNLESYDAAEAQAAYEREHGKPRRDPRFPTWMLPWERYLTISHPKFATKRESIAKIPGRMEITLEVGTVLTGRVLEQKHGESPEPAGNVELFVKYMMSDPRTDEEPRPVTLHISANSGGEYRTEAIEAGPVTVTANAAGWFGKAVQLTAEDDKVNQVPDIILTRGGRVRIRLIDDDTGKPLEFPTTTKAFVTPQPLPRGGEIETVVDFSLDGVGEQQLPAGKYHFLVRVPEINGRTELKDKLFATIRDIDSLDEHPTHEVVEGEVRQIEVRMVRREVPVQANAIVVPLEN